MMRIYSQMTCLGIILFVAGALTLSYSIYAGSYYCETHQEREPYWIGGALGMLFFGMLSLVSFEMGGWFYLPPKPEKPIPLNPEIMTWRCH
jgi:hypothetical protein